MATFQNSQTEQNPREQKNTPVREFPELDPTEQKEPGEVPDPKMAGQNSKRTQDQSTSNTNVNNRPDRDTTSDYSRGQGTQEDRNQTGDQKTSRTSNTIRE